MLALIESSRVFLAQNVFASLIFLELGSGKVGDLGGVKRNNDAP
jgi:hypothetical protein